MSSARPRTRRVVNGGGAETSTVPVRDPKEVLDKRRAVDGSVEYLVQWHDAPIPTWLSAHDMDEHVEHLALNFERRSTIRRRNNLDEIRSKRERCVVRPLTDPDTKQFVQIIGVTDMSATDTCAYLCEWSDSTASLVPSSVARDRWPEAVRQFLSRQLKLSQNSIV